MSESKQNRDQFILRMPDGMRDRIKAVAFEGGRSMNAEIIRTLRRTYPSQLDTEMRVISDRIHDIHDMLGDEISNLGKGAEPESVIRERMRKLRAEQAEHIEWMMKTTADIDDS